MPRICNCWACRTARSTSPRSASTRRPATTTGMKSSSPRPARPKQCGGSRRCSGGSRNWKPACSSWNGASYSMLQRFNPNHDPATGEFSEGGGSDGGGSAKPASEKPGGGKGGKGKVSKVSDFNKKGIRLVHDTTINAAKAEKFMLGVN